MNVPKVIAALNRLCDAFDKNEEKIGVDLWRQFLRAIETLPVGAFDRMQEWQLRQIKSKVEQRIVRLEADSPVQ